MLQVIIYILNNILYTTLFRKKTGDNFDCTLLIATTITSMPV